jgi:hypothetical protein
MILFFFVNVQPSFHVGERRVRLGDGVLRLLLLIGPKVNEPGTARAEVDPAR